MSEYQKLTDEDGEPIECDCCQYPAPVSLFKNTLTEYSNMIVGEDKYFCEICASTFLSSSVTYPSQCNDPKLHQSIGWIANFLAEKIEKMANGSR